MDKETAADIDGNEIQTVLDSVLEWQKDPGHYDLQVKNLKRVTQFLKLLKTKLQESGNVEEALGSLPQVGQLLGRLCTLPFLLSNPPCYEALLNCVLFFYVQRPASAIEKKARTWALSQIQCHLQRKNQSSTLQFSGSSQKEYNDAWLNEIRNTISKQGKLQHQETSQSLLPLPAGPLVPQAGLVETCRICLHLSGQSHFRQLFTVLLQQVCRSVPPSGQEQLNKLLTEVTQTQTSAYQGECSCELPRETLICVWRCHLEALEEEVLCLLQVIHKQLPMSRGKLTDLMKSRGLVDACTIHSQIYNSVFGMMYQVYLQSHNNELVAGAIWCLHQAVREQMWATNQQTIILSSQYPAELQPLIHVLHIPTTTLSKQCCAHQIRCLGERIEGVMGVRSSAVGSSAVGSSAVGEDTELDLLLLQHRDWQHLAMLLALLADQQCVPSCLKVATFFTGTPSLEQQRHLEDTVECLRGLMSKNNLKSHDLEYAISANQMTGDSDVTHPLIGQILLLFLLCSYKGTHIWKFILTELMKIEDACSQLRSVLDTLELCLPYWHSWLPRTDGWVRDVQHLLESLCQQVTCQANEALMDGEMGCEQLNPGYNEQAKLRLLDWACDVKKLLKK